jgi:hypothetical protein
MFVHKSVVQLNVAGIDEPVKPPACRVSRAARLFSLVNAASARRSASYKVIVPVDCSAGEDEYHEQYAAFHLAKGGPVGVTSQVTLTRSAMIKF